MDYSELLANAIKAFLDERDILYGFSEEEGRFITDFTIDETGEEVEVAIAVLEDGFACYVMLPWVFDSDYYPYVGEFLHRANYGLLNGNFELDYENGAIQYKTFGYCPDEKVSNDVLEAVLLGPLVVIDHYIGGLRKLMNKPNSNIARLIAELDV